MTADFTREGCDPWWTAVDTAPRCDHCGTRLERIPGTQDIHPCPFGPHEGDAA